MSLSTPQPPSVSASIHVYRGLMDRAATWRQRIDSPTNWAITTSGTVASFTLNDPIHSHAVLLLVMLFMLAFLVIEARRMRYYDLWASWVRVLETDYLVGILRDGSVSLNQPWEQLLVSDLEDPHFKISTLHLLGQRLRDNYLALYLFVLLCWLLKLLLHQPLDQGFESDSLVARAAVGLVPGWLVIAGVAVFYVMLFALTLMRSRRYASVEVLERQQTLRRMTNPHLQQMSRRQSQRAMLARFVSDEDDDPLETRDWD